MKYSAAPRITRTSSVEKPLHATSCQRTRCISRPSALSASRPAASRSPPVTPSGIAETVPDAADRLDPRPDIAELRPQVVDVGVDGIRRARAAARPGLVEQLVTRQRLAGVAEEAFEEGELARAEVDLAAASGDPPGRFVEADRTDLQDRRRPAGTGGSPRECPQPRRQLLVGERLDQVIVGARVEAAHPVVDRVAGGQHQDRQLGPLPPEATSHLEARHVGQPDVENDRLDPGTVFGDRQAGLAVRSNVDDVAVLLEEPPECPAEALVVLDDEEMHRCPSVIRWRRSGDDRTTPRQTRRGAAQHRWAQLAPPRARAMRSAALLIGVAKPRPSALPAIAVLIPMTAPEASISGPPLLPGLIAASVWMRSCSVIGRPVCSSATVMSRSRAEMMPFVTVSVNVPSGLPMAQGG